MEQARKHDALLLLVLATAGILAYWQSFSVPFLFDDIGSIPANPRIRQLWPLDQVLSTPPYQTVSGRPLVQFTLAVNYALSGLAPWSYHFVNLLLHLLVGLLLWAILRATLVNETVSPWLRARAGPIATCVTALWLVHPLNSEAVVYTIQRTELLASLCLLLTLQLSLRFFQQPGRLVYALAAGAAAWAGAMSKETIAGVPLLVLLYDQMLVSGSFKAALKRHRWLYALLVSSWIPLALLIAGGARAGSVGVSLGVSPLDYLRTQAGVIVWYLRLSLWPAPLSLFYDWPIVGSWGPALLPGLVVAALLAATLWALWRRQVIGLAGALFFLVLAPSSSFVPVVTEVAAERRMYLPLAAVLAVLTAVLWRRLSALAAKWNLPASSRRNWATALPAAVAALLLFATAKRVADYQSALSIWQDTAQKYPDSAVVQTGLGAALSGIGDYPRALEHYRQAAALRPDYPEAWANMADALLRLGQVQESVAAARQGLAVAAEHPVLLINLAAGLSELGQWDQAQAALELALTVQPDSGVAHLSLARALQQQNQWERAGEHWEAGLRLEPERTLAILAGLGKEQMQQRHWQHAVAVYRLVAAAQPEALAARANLAVALMHLGQLQEAEEHGRAALALDGQDPRLHYNLGQILAKKGQRELAAAAWQRAAELDPAWPAPREQLELLRAGAASQPARLQQ